MSADPTTRSQLGHDPRGGLPRSIDRAALVPALRPARRRRRGSSALPSPPTPPGRAEVALVEARDFAGGRRARRRSSSTAVSATCASATSGSCARRITNDARVDEDRRAAPRAPDRVSPAAVRAWPVPPVVRAERHRRLLGAGSLAAALAGGRRPRPTARAGATDQGLRSCALYADATTNDTRLCLANVRAAADAGACVLNRAEVVALRKLDGRVVGAEVLVDGGDVSVDARVVVNAAGPWVDRVRRLEDPQAGTSVRLSRGAHVLVPGGGDWHAALTLPQDEVRVTFAVPWSGMLLLGTTEAPYDGDPADVEPEAVDAEQILREAAQALPAAARAGSGVGGVRGSPRAPRRRGRGRERSSRDGVHPGARRHAERRGRQAHDLPPHRARGAGAPPFGPGYARWTSDRGRYPGRPGSSRSRFPASSRRTSARTCCTCTEASHPRCSRRCSRSRRSSSALARTARTSPRRCATRRRTSGRRPSRTSSADGRRSIVGSTTRPRAAVAELLPR